MLKFKKSDLFIKCLSLENIRQFGVFSGIRPTLLGVRGGLPEQVPTTHII